MNLHDKQFCNTKISHAIKILSDIPMFYIKYLTMYELHMHAGPIRKLLYGCAHVREIIHSLKLVDYLPVHTHKPYNNLHLKSELCLKCRVITLVSVNIVLSFAKMPVCEHPWISKMDSIHQCQCENLFIILAIWPKKSDFVYVSK